MQFDKCKHRHFVCVVRFSVHQMITNSVCSISVLSSFPSFFFDFVKEEHLVKEEKSKRFLRCPHFLALKRVHENRYGVKDSEPTQILCENTFS